jgi:hypothetical protein
MNIMPTTTYLCQVENREERGEREREREREQMEEKDISE